MLPRRVECAAAMKLPQGYIEHRSGNRICFLKEDLQSLLGELGFLDGAPTRAAETTLLGSLDTGDTRSDASSRISRCGPGQASARPFPCSIR